MVDIYVELDPNTTSRPPNLRQCEQASRGMLQVWVLVHGPWVCVWGVGDHRLVTIPPAHGGHHRNIWGTVQGGFGVLCPHMAKVTDLSRI